MIHIYGLVESGKKVGQIRYIGITADPNQRLHQHRTTKENTDKGRWIADLRKSKRNVDMVLLDSAPTRDEAHAKENAWILFARYRGWDLVNGTVPGEHRSKLDGEISSTEAAMAAVSKVLVESASIKADMLHRLDVERKNNSIQQKIIDSHFRKWYQVLLAVILAVLSFSISAWILHGYHFRDAVRDAGQIGALSMLIGAAVAYPCIAFILWFFLKDVPLYRPSVGSKEWLSSLDVYESVSYAAVKRITWHIVGTAIILGTVAFFAG